MKRGAGWRDRDDWGWSVLHEAAAAGQQPGQVHPCDCEIDASFAALVPNIITCSEIDIVVVEGIHWVCRESKGLINVADKLGRSPLLAGLMAGAGLAAVTELLKQGDGSRA